MMSSNSKWNEYIPTEQQDEGPLCLSDTGVSVILPKNVLSCVRMLCSANGTWRWVRVGRDKIYEEKGGLALERVRNTHDGLHVRTGGCAEH